MSKPISVPVVTSKGEVWYSGEKAGVVDRVPDTRYWAAFIPGPCEYLRFNSKKKAIAYLVERADMGDLRPDHYRRFGTSKATGSLAPMSDEYASFPEAEDDPAFDRRPRAILACRNVWLNGEPRILVHHPGQGVVTYEGQPGFRPIPAGSTVEAR